MGMVAGGAPGGSCFCPAPALSRALCGAEYGLKLGSQLFIKHIVESGLAAKGSSLQEGDLILKVRGPKGSTGTCFPWVGCLVPEQCLRRGQGEGMLLLASCDSSWAGSSSIWCPHPAPVVP